MADQTQRLEIATVKAEVGSNILYRFSNDEAAASAIPTDSGDIQNLKQVVAGIQEDAADKISVATTIYQTAAAGLAASTVGGIFLVQSSNADEIYTVWQNVAGAAVNTGKTAMSSQAVQDALTASNQAAQAAEDAADVATNRTAGFLSPAATAPVVRDDGLSLQVGDRYFNTNEQAEYLYTSNGWSANESQAAVADLDARITLQAAPGNTPKAGEDGLIGRDWIPDFGSEAEYQIQNLHKKSIVCQLPIVFPDYVAIQTAGGNSYLYPQGFFFDERSNEILIAYNANGGTVYTRTIAVYDATTFKYKSCFILSLPTGSGGGESFTVTYPSAGGRYLVNKYSDVVVAFYDITVLPDNLQVVPAFSQKTVAGAYFQLSSKGGRFLIEDTGPTIGGPNTRTQFSVYDSDFNRIGAFSYTKFDSGFTGLADNALAPFIPKAQGVALGNGCVATVHGGIIVFNDPTSFNKYAYLGPRLYSPDGQKIAESICDPFKMKEIFEANGLPTDRFEYEGICVTESNKVMTLNLHQSRLGAQATLTGIVIMREFSPEPDAIDFTSAVYTFTHPGKASLETGLYPRANGYLYNPVTGAQFVTIEQVLDYMDLMQVGRFSYYDPSNTLASITGLALGSNALVTIVNRNHLLFYVSVLSTDGVKNYQVTGSSGSRTAGLLLNTTNGFRMATEAAGSVDRLHRMRAESRDPTTLDALFLDLQMLTANTDLRIGGGSAAFKACTQLRMFTAPDVSSASVERWQVTAAGILRPFADNAYSLGLSSARVTQLFAATATIGTSDERVKTAIGPISDQVLDAWESVQFAQFKFVDAVEKKGAGARIHFGVIAQRVKEAFEAAGLDPFAYSVLCWDEWKETPAETETWDDVFDEDGNLVKAAGSFTAPAIPAGDRYGIRYEEALVLEAALMRRATKRLEDRLSALEQR